MSARPIKIKLNMKIIHDEVERQFNAARGVEGLPPAVPLSWKILPPDINGDVFADVYPPEIDSQGITRAVNLEATKLSNGYSVRLKGVSKEGISLINRYGQWWKVAQQNARDCWLMTNYPSKKQGRFAGTSTAMITITVKKDGTDEHVAVVDSIAFPREFVLAEHKGD